MDLLKLGIEDAGDNDTVTFKTVHQVAAIETIDILCRG